MEETALRLNYIGLQTILQRPSLLIYLLTCKQKPAVSPKITKKLINDLGKSPGEWFCSKHEIITRWQIVHLYLYHHYFKRAKTLFPHDGSPDIWSAQKK